jgi:hypothetical protein
MSAQVRIRHFGCFHPGERQPGHRFFSRKNAIQIPQFIPQGATSLAIIEKARKKSTEHGGIKWPDLRSVHIRWKNTINCFFY